MLVFYFFRIQYCCCYEDCQLSLARSNFVVSRFLIFLIILSWIASFSFFPELWCENECLGIQNINFPELKCYLFNANKNFHKTLYLLLVKSNAWRNEELLSVKLSIPVSSYKPKDYDFKDSLRLFKFKNGNGFIKAHVSINSIRNKIKLACHAFTRSLLPY